MRKTTNKFSPEVRERAVRLVLDNEGQHASCWQAVMSISAKIGCTPQTLNDWVKKAEIDSGSRHLGGGLELTGRELAPDPEGLAQRLRRVRIVQGGEMNDAALIAALRPHSQGLVVVNSRAQALTLFRQAQAEGLEGLVHLTTRHYPAHRRRILAEIRARLKQGTACRLIATSLIEAGVDLDFPLGWRAAAGLDSIVQTAGRVNREG